MKTEEKSRKDNILGWDNKDKLKKKIKIGWSEEE